LKRVIIIGKIANFINACEPEEPDKCEITPIHEETSEDGPILSGFMATLGEITAPVIIHNAPTPAMDIIETTQMKPEVKEQLMAHKSFALLNAMGGENYRPVEKTILLWKLAAAMCQQGAIGVANIYTEFVLPAEVVSNLASVQVLKDSPNLWDALRKQGEPFWMLARIVRTESMGKPFLATCGYAFCGFPDLVWECTDEKDMRSVAEVFENGFHYMMENGPVISAGHTMGYDKNVAFRFPSRPKASICHFLMTTCCWSQRKN